MPSGDPGKAPLTALFAPQQKVARYFPTERGQPMVHGALSLALSSVRTTETHVERVLSLQFRDQSLKRSLVHLHFPTWPELCVCRLGGGSMEGGKASVRCDSSPPSPQGPARQPQQPAALHPGGARALPAPAAPAHAHRRALQLRGGPHGSLCAALRGCAGGGGGEQAPRAAPVGAAHAAAEEAHAAGEGEALGADRLCSEGSPTPADQPVPLQLHLRFCHEAVVRHVEQVLQRHGVPPPCRPLAGTGVSQKVRQGRLLGQGQRSLCPALTHLSFQNHLPQDSQDLVLGGDVPISSIQATIAKLSIRPPGGLDSPVACLPGPVEPPGLLPASLPQATQLPSSSPPPLSSPLPETPQPEEEQPVPEVPSPGPPSSSLELLASLTPEAFSLDSSLRGKQRMSKQNFLHAHNGQGLRAAPPADDPLSLLDPLWTLNKT